MNQKKSFALGYSLVFHSILTYFIFGAFTTSGMNVWNPAFCGAYGWDNGVLLTMATVASLVGVLGSVLFGQLVAKKGARGVITLTLIVCGVAIALFGYIHSVAGYLVCMIVFNFAGHGFCNVGSNAVIANWFPRRKGFILGITTMGLPAASFLFVPILNVSIGGLGLSHAFLIIGIAVAILGVVSWFWIRDTPQEVGLQPDNGKYPTQQGVNSGNAHRSIWTIKKLLTNRNVWLIAFAYGLLFLVTQGMISQTVPYLMQNGFQQDVAVRMLSIAAAIGLVGSFVWGVIDDRIGTKKASIIYAAWYMLTFLILALPMNQTIAFVGVILLGTSLGGIGNLMPSMMITAFGPREFASVSRVITTAGNIVRSLSFLVMAVGAKAFGKYSSVAWILLVISGIAMVMIVGITSYKADEK